MKKILWFIPFIFAANLGLASNHANVTMHLKLGGTPSLPLVPNTYFTPARVWQGSTAPDTVRILALRVAFQPDTLSSTTGDGTFQLSKRDSIYIDPPPHNRTYFQAQLASLSHYYRTVSHGKLIIQGDVYPPDLNGSYQLPHSMDYYNPNRSEAELDQRLSELLRDALRAAADSGPIPATRYDGIFIFHAGVGSDVALDYDATPQDIPSAFLNFDHLKKTLGKNDPDFKGIPFENILVKQAVILPETEVQSTKIQIGLKGTMALMTGHFLGLPALYDVKTGTSGIGKWGLMDQGSGNYFGLLPAQPCAWSKVFMGWEKPIVLRPGTSIRVGVARAKTAPHIYKIPVTRDEYFLIENRNHDFNGDSMAVGRDQYGNRVELDANGQLKAQDSLGVIVQVDDYDFDIPGSGILVWHIDDAIIRRYYKSNAVNANPEHKGVELMEADGSQDIGQNYGFLGGGSGSELGTMYDPFFQGNQNHLAANHSQTVEFGPYTAPSSRSFAGANTHIVLKDFSPIDTVMSFSFENDLFQTGFPAAVELPGNGAFPPLIFDALDSGSAQIFVATQKGRLLGWTADGRKLVPNADSLDFETDPGKMARFPLARLVEIGDSLVAPPLPFWNAKSDAWDLLLVGKSGSGYRVHVHPGTKGSAELEQITLTQSKPTAVLDLGPAAGKANGLPKIETVVLGDASGKITLYKNDGVSQTFRVRTLQKSPVAGLCRFSHLSLAQVSSPDTFAVLLQNSWLYTLDSEGTLLDSTRVPLEGPYLPPTAGFLTDRKTLVLVVASQNGRLAVLDVKGGAFPGFPVDVGMAIASRPVLADVTQSGENEILVSGKSALFAFEPNGVLATGFPKIYRHTVSNEWAVWNAPAVLQVDSASEPLILIGNTSGQLQAFSKTNHRHFDFPLQTEGPVVTSPVLTELRKGENPVAAVVSKDGFLYVWHVPGTTAEKSHLLWSGFDSFQSGLQLQLKPVNTNSKGDLTGENWAYNYPNPARGESTTIRYHLNAPAKVSVKIMDLTGNLVDSFSGPGFGPADHEIPWNVAKIPSGVYLARVEAVGGGQTKVRFFKIAVVK